MQINQPKIKLILEDLTYKINGILFRTQNDLGRYCNELQYGDYIEKLLKETGVNYEREKRLPASFQGESPGRNKVDFLIDDNLILELKTKRFISKQDYYQTQRYLKALNKKLGILVNFRDQFLKPKRIINSSGKM